jgi:hypothetical protein
MVQKAETYKWSSCGAHVRGTVNQYLTGKEWLQESERNEYRKLLYNESSDDAMLIKQATSTGETSWQREFRKVFREET